MSSESVLPVTVGADGFFRALCQAVPIGLDTRVPAATRRQANCYYSSSDAAFADRYHAYAEYDRALAGEVPLDGGWRVYSSGAGIATALIFRCFLGLRWEPSRLVIDPAIPKRLDGLRAELELGGMRFEITYRIEANGCGVRALELNGRDLPFTAQAPSLPQRWGRSVDGGLAREHYGAADSADGLAGVSERGGAPSSPDPKQAAVIAIDAFPGCPSEASEGRLMLGEDPERPSGRRRRMRACAEPTALPAAEQARRSRNYRPRPGGALGSSE